MRIVLLFIILLFALPAAMAQERAWSGQWAHKKSRLRADENVKWGRLGNGLRYALLPRQGAPERVSMRLLVLVGSIEETDRELGIAHFMEHMAFNGTRDFPADDLISFLQSLGMEHGYDVNATTSFDHTFYSLEYWDNEVPLLNKGLLFLRNICDGILFDSSEIGKERKVILSEMRGRDELNFRAQVDAYKLIFRGLRFTERIPIGTPESINSLSRDQFLGFYRKWYRPDLMVLVIVGDFESSLMERMVEEGFGDMKESSDPIPKRNIGRLQRTSSLRAAAYRITDVGSANIQAASVIPMRKRSETVETRRQNFNRKFSMALLTQRLQRAVPDTANGQADYMRMFEHDTAIASVAAGSANWLDGVQSLDRVIRMTIRDGFLSSEVEWLRKRELSKTRKLRTFYSKLDPTSIANSIVQSVVDHRTFVGMQQELEWQVKFLLEMNGKVAHRSFRECWDLERMAYHISGEIDIEESAKKIRNAIARARQEAPNLYLNRSQFELEYEPMLWGNPGMVVESSAIPEFQAHLMRFQNNVRLNFIETQHEPGLMRAIVRIGGGLFDQEENMPGLREFALQAFLGSGIQRYELSDVQTIIASSMLAFSFDVDDHDAFTFRGVFGSEDLDLFLGIVTDYLRDPKIHRSSYWDAMVGSLVHRMQSAVGMLNGYRAFQDFLFEDDGRFSWGDMRDYTALGVSDVRNWMEEPLRNGYIEVSIVGDISKAGATQSVARSLGALKERRISKLHPEPKHPIEITAPAGYRRIEFVGEEHQAGVIGFWFSDRSIDLHDEVALQVLSRIVKTRMWKRLREELGVSYSPTAEFSSYDEYPDFSTIEAKIDCSPDDAPAIAEVLLGISTKLSRDGVTQEEVDGALGPFRVKVRQALRSNDYLVNSLLKRAQERPDLTSEIIALKNGSLDEMTADKVNEFAREMFKPENSRTAAIIPKPFIGIFQIETE